MLRTVVTAEVSVPERVQVLMEPESGVVWLRGKIVSGRRATEYEAEQAIVEALYDARWILAEWARDAGLIPLKQSLGYARGFPYFFDGELAALGFERVPERCSDRQVISQRRT